MGEAMETIARIPRLAPAAAAQPTAAVEEVAPPPQPAVFRSGIPVGAGRRRPPFPAWSVATLTVIAAIAWTLATWHEQERLARQRQPARLALQPPATAVETITP
jgi:hypothetical protein